MRDPVSRARAGRGRPLAVLFESPSCRACAEMHERGVRARTDARLLSGFDVARLIPGAPTILTAPDGRRLDAADGPAT